MSSDYGQMCGIDYEEETCNKKLDASDIFDIYLRLRVQSIVYFRVNEQFKFNRIYRNMYFGFDELNGYSVATHHSKLQRNAK